MIKIKVNLKRYITNDQKQISELLIDGLSIKGHSRNRSVCNMASAISLYGIGALIREQDWKVVQDKGLLEVSRATHGVPDHQDANTMRTIIFQLLGLSKQFPKDIEFAYLIPEVDGNDFHEVSIAQDGTTTSKQDDKNGKTIKGN